MSEQNAPTQNYLDGIQDRLDEVLRSPTGDPFDPDTPAKSYLDVLRPKFDAVLRIVIDLEVAKTLAHDAAPGDEEIARTHAKIVIRAWLETRLATELDRAFASV